MATNQPAYETPENDTQDAPMPSADQQTGSETGNGGVSPVEEQTIPETASLPEQASVRTRNNFEKMRQDLHDERERRKYYESVYGALTPKETVKPIQPVFDPTTGRIDGTALTDLQQRTYAAEERAQKAEEGIKEFHRVQENTALFTEFPELNPDDKKGFNKALHVETRRLLLDSMMNPDDYEGKQLSGNEAARLAKQRLPTTVETARKEGAREALEQLTPKEQASLSASGSPSRRQEVSTDLEDLRRRIRRGDRSASIEYAKRILGEK